MIDSIYNNLEELRELIASSSNNNLEELDKLYDVIATQVRQDINYNELSAVTIVRDISAIRLISPKKAKMIEMMITNPEASYGDIAKAIGVSRQYVCNEITRISANVLWISKLLTYRKGLTGYKGTNNYEGRNGRENRF